MIYFGQDVSMRKSYCCCYRAIVLGHGSKEIFLIYYMKSMLRKRWRRWRRWLRKRRRRRNWRRWKRRCGRKGVLLSQFGCVLYVMHLLLYGRGVLSSGSRHVSLTCGCFSFVAVFGKTGVNDLTVVTRKIFSNMELNIFLCFIR